MADFRINVVVDPANAQRGTRQVDNSLRRTERNADRLRGTIARAFSFIAVGAGIRQITLLADTFTNLQNRLGQVTTSTRELAAVTDELFEVSRRTRQSFETTAELYARVALSTRELGISQRQTVQFTESLNQAVVLSGASAQEAQAGLIQLSQGLASGTLRGDELRSVLEQLPAVADVISESLGVTRGELRQLGTDGRINADVVIQAFAEAREELAERFARTIPTVGQAFVVLRNSIIQTVGAFDQSSGASTAFARAILALADNFDVLLRSLGTVITALTIGFTRQAIGGAINAVRTLTLLIAANPIGAIVVGVTLAISALINFSDQIAFTSDGLVTLADFARAVFQIVSENVSSIANSFRSDFGGAIMIAQQLVASLGLSFDGLFDLIVSFINRSIGLFVGFGRSVSSIFSDISEVVRSVFSGDAILDGETSLLDIAGRIGRNASTAFTEGFEQDFVGDLVGLVTPAFESVVDRARSISQQRIAEENRRQEADQAARAALSTTRAGGGAGAVDTGFQEILQGLQQQASLLQLNNREREIQQGLLAAQDQLNRQLSESENTLLDSELRRVQSLQNQSDILESIRGPQDEYVATLEAANALLQQGTISIQEYNAALQQTQLGGAISDLQTQLGGGDQFEIQTDAIREQLAERQELVQQAVDARVLTELEGINLITQAQMDAAAQIQAIEQARFSSQLQAGQQTFGALASITGSFVGQQSSAYRNLFAIQKGFALASSIIAVQTAISNSAKLGFPQNVAAIAGAVAQTAGIVAEIRGTQFAGAFQNGGDFTVAGSGGTDSQMVSFQATPGERVSVQTPQQQRTGDGPTPPPQSEAAPVTIVNVVDPALVEDFLNTPAGERLLVNSIGRNASSVNSALQGGL